MPPLSTCPERAPEARPASPSPLLGHSAGSGLPRPPLMPTPHPGASLLASVQSLQSSQGGDGTFDLAASPAGQASSLSCPCFPVCLRWATPTPTASLAHRTLCSPRALAHTTPFLWNGLLPISGLSSFPEDSYPAPIPFPRFQAPLTALAQREFYMCDSLINSLPHQTAGPT